MPVTQLNHYFVRANDLDATRDFYVNVLGFQVLPRPDFPFRGYWLGVDGTAQIHMGPHDVPNAELYYLGTPKNAARDHTGVIDHVAFLATDPEAFRRRFEAMKISYRPRYQSEARLFQLFVQDPNGVTIELNFLGVDSNTTWGGEDYSTMPRTGAD
jgi:catechol 2,3-dioxygenase-like lactoylglutathione lyase family enzyme